MSEIDWTAARRDLESSLAAMAGWAGYQPSDLALALPDGLCEDDRDRYAELAAEYGIRIAEPEGG